MKEFTSLQRELENLQNETIALAKVYGQVSLVVEMDKNTITIVDLGYLGELGISSISRNNDYVQIYEFPKEYSTLYDFLQDPIEFKNWFSETI
jgi:hypothetical protein